MAGLRLELKDDNDPHRDAAIQSYGALPLSWDNGGRGGVNVTAQPSGSDLGAVLTAFTGKYGPLHNRSVAHPFLLAAFHSKSIGEQ